MRNVASRVSEVAGELADVGGRGNGRGAAHTSAGSHTVSVIGGGITVTGDVKGDGEIRIEGRVDGSVSTTGRVIVEAGGDVQGDVHAQEVIANGKVCGNITASGAVRLKDGCQVEADVTATSIELEEGGTVNGRLNMGKKKN